MVLYNVNTDQLSPSQGNLDKDHILKTYGERRIFELVFGYCPTEFQYTTSPFRNDCNPGCWFEYSPISGKLLFIDFGGEKTHYDCFEAVKTYFSLDKFNEVIEFIDDALSTSGMTLIPEAPTSRLRESQRAEIFVSTRQYLLKDKAFWTRYGISKENLIEDRVFPIDYLLIKSKNVYSSNISTPAYCYNFGKRKKIYQPYNKQRKFITNCTANDVGHINKLPKKGKTLVITKSYKDSRVLMNEGLNSVWFQNEGMFPSDKVLLPICQNFDKVVVFFDNDQQGIKSSSNLQNHINSHFQNKCKTIKLSPILKGQGIKDPSDLYHRRGKDNLRKFLVRNELRKTA